MANTDKDKTTTASTQEPSKPVSTGDEVVLATPSEQADVDPATYGDDIDMSNPAKADKSDGPELNMEVEAAFGRVPTYFGRVDLLIAAVGKIGGSGLAKYLNEIVDSIDKAEAPNSVQARRDAQQAALDAEFAALKNANGLDFGDDPRTAEIAPIEQPASVTATGVGGLDELAAAQGRDGA